MSEPIITLKQFDELALQFGGDPRQLPPNVKNKILLRGVLVSNSSLGHLSALMAGCLAGHPVPTEAFKPILSDVLTLTHQMATALGLSFSELAELTVGRLRASNLTAPQANPELN